MVNKKGLFLLAAFVSVLVAVGCVSAPVPENPRFIPHHYTFSVLFDPDHPGTSPDLEVAMSLLEMMYPRKDAEFFNDVLYSSGSPDSYRDWVVVQQRQKYRRDEHQGKPNWRYEERLSVNSAEKGGLVVEREYYIYEGGAHGLTTKRYYVIDIDSRRLLKIDDLFHNFQGEAIRNVIYQKLREYSKLSQNQPLSQGIFFSDEPELTFNFFVTQEGLGLHWDPYEIAPYAVGSVEIIVPWRNIRPLMLHSGMELLTKFDICLFM